MAFRLLDSHEEAIRHAEIGAHAGWPVNSSKIPAAEQEHLDYLRRVPRRSAAHAPRFGRAAHRHRHDSRGRSAAHRSQRPSATPTSAARDSRRQAAPAAQLARRQDRRQRSRRLHRGPAQLPEGTPPPKGRRRSAAHPRNGRTNGSERGTDRVGQARNLERAARSEEHAERRRAFHRRRTQTHALLRAKIRGRNWRSVRAHVSRNANAIAEPARSTIRPRRSDPSLSPRRLPQDVERSARPLWSAVALLACLPHSICWLSAVNFSRFRCGMLSSISQCLPESSSILAPSSLCRYKTTAAASPSTHRRLPPTSLLPTASPSTAAVSPSFPWKTTASLPTFPAKRFARLPSAQAAAR